MNSTRTANGSQCNFISSGVAWLNLIAYLSSWLLSSILSEAVIIASEAVSGAVHYQHRVYL